MWVSPVLPGMSADVKIWVNHVPVINRGETMVCQESVLRSRVYLVLLQH